MFRVVVEEIMLANNDADKEILIERYSQKVDVVDLQKIIAAVNAKPRKPRERKTKDAPK